MLQTFVQAATYIQLRKDDTMNTAHMMLTIVIGGFIAFLLGFGVTKIIELLLNLF